MTGPEPSPLQNTTQRRNPEARKRPVLTRSSSAGGVQNGRVLFTKLLPPPPLDRDPPEEDQAARGGDRRKGGVHSREKGEAPFKGTELVQ